MHAGRAGIEGAWRWLAVAANALLAGACGGGGSGTGDSDGAGFVGSMFYQIAAGDLNDDGRIDLAAIAVVQDGNSNTPDPIELQVLVQDPARPGHFAVAQRLALTTALGVVAVADLDGDGQDDIVVTEPANDRIKVFLQDRAVPGQFALTDTRAAGIALGSIEVADVDLDGAPDIVLAFGGGVEVLHQNPAAPGTFPLLTVVDGTLNGGLALPPDDDSLAVGDLNDDALVDLVTVRADPGVRLYPQDPAVPGTFQPALGFSLSLNAPHAVAVADIDGDGFNDLAAAGDTGGLFPDPVMSIGLENPAAPGTFLPVLKYALDEHGEPRQVVIADVTDDGRADVIVPKFYVLDRGYVEVLAQTGPPFGLQRLALLAPLLLPGVDPHLRGFVVTDLNDDGLPDMAVTDGELSGLFNDPAAPGSFFAARRLLD